MLILLDFLERDDRLLTLDLLTRDNISLKKIRELFLRFHGVVRLGILSCVIILIYYNEQYPLPFEQRFIAYFLLRDTEHALEKNIYRVLLEFKRNKTQHAAERIFLASLLSEEHFPKVSASNCNEVLGTEMLGSTHDCLASMCFARIALSQFSHCLACGKGQSLVLHAQLVDTGLRWGLRWVQ